MSLESKVCLFVNASNQIQLHIVALIWSICSQNQVSLNARSKKIGEQGRKAALDGMKNIHDRAVLSPIKLTIFQRQNDNMQ